MRFIEIATALDELAMWDETQVWLEAQAISTPWLKRLSSLSPLKGLP